MSDVPGREITIEEMLRLRAGSERVSSWFRGEIDDRLSTLKSLLAPRRFLADHVESPYRVEEAPEADRNFSELQAAYKSVAKEPLRLPGRLESPLGSIPNQVELHPWEYTLEIQAPEGPRRVTVRSPLSWVLVHGAPITLAQARQMSSGAIPRNEPALRQFAIHALLMKLIVERSPGLVRLFAAMRMKLETAESPELGALPLVRVTASVPTFRPADAVIQSAIRISGVPIFEELVDLQAVTSLEDPLRSKIAELE
jgi:hypothetical protein